MRERASSMQDRRRSLGFLRRGNFPEREGGGDDEDDDEDDDEYDSEDETTLGDVMQREHLKHSLNTHDACRVDYQDDDGHNSDANIEPFVDASNPDYMNLDNHEHVRKNDAGEYVFDYEAMDYEALMKLGEEGYYEQVGDLSGRVYPSDSKREPRLTFPSDHVMPPEDFVDRYTGYMFITGLLPVRL